MFEELSQEEASLVFQGLKALVESNSGFGFYNMDQGHPFYRFGAAGEEMPATGIHEEGPEVNTLYNMLGSLNDRLEREGCSGCVWWYDFRRWQKFCRFAVDSYDRAHAAQKERLNG